MIRMQLCLVVALYSISLIVSNYSAIRFGAELNKQTNKIK